MYRILMSALLLVMLGFGTVTGATAAAQEGTPIVGVCDAPELPPGTPTPMEEMGQGEMEMAEGEATPAAGEEPPAMAGADASPIPAGEPADEATAERVTMAIAGVIACYNEGNFLGVGALFTPAGLMDEFGTANPYDLETFLPGGPPLELLSVTDVQVHADGRYSADVVSSFAGGQLSRERWFLVESGDQLLIDVTPDLEVEAPAGAVTIEAAMVDFAFELSETTVPANTPLVFEVTNMGEYPHELVIIQLPEGATVDDVLAGNVGVDQVQFFGATFSEGGQPAPDLVLSGLEAGTYTLVCFVDVPEGIPHVARGMYAELVVE